MWIAARDGASLFHRRDAGARAAARSRQARAPRASAWPPLVVLARRRRRSSALGADCARFVASAAVAALPMAFTHVGDVVGAAALPRIVLWPFIALARPLFARDRSARSAGARRRAASCYVVTVVWVLRSDEAFEDAADDALARHGRQTQPAAAPRYRARPSAGRWRLRPAGGGVRLEGRDADVPRRRPARAACGSSLILLG